MSSILRELDLCADVEEFGGLNGDELDDLNHDLFGDGKLVDEDEEELAELPPPIANDDDDLFDDTGNAQDLRSRRAAAAARHKRAADERIERMAEQEAFERELGFTQPVQRQLITLRTQRPHDWWLSAAGAATMYSDDDHATEIVMAHINRSLSSKAPPTSLGRVIDLPKRLSAIRFEPWVAQTTTEVVDTNSVATFYTGLLPHLPDVALRSVVFCFNLRRFAACKTTMSDGTILLFCGSAVCTGPKGPARSNAQCQRYVLWLNRLGIPATLQGYRLQNLVSKASAGFEIDLNLLHTKYPFHAQYKPHRFPGVIFRLDFEDETVLNAEQSMTLGTRRQDQIVAIFFKSSKTIITGSRTRAKTRLVWTLILNMILREFKRVTNDQVHVSEAAYRRLVHEERSIIDYTCQHIQRIASERANFDLFSGDAADGDVPPTPALLNDVRTAHDEAARASRKRQFAETLGDFFLSEDAEAERRGAPSPVGRFVDARMAALRGRDQSEIVASWVARNVPLINQ